MANVADISALSLALGSGRISRAPASRSLRRPNAPAKPSRRVCRAHSSGPEEEEASSGGYIDTKAFRRALNQSDNYNRQGFGHKEEALEKMDSEYTSE
jgi:hypothetical protein